MVVVFDDENKNAKVSLRQQEILAKLSSIVNDINADCPEQLVHFLGGDSLISLSFQYLCTHFSSRIWSIYAGIDSWFSLYGIYHRSSICRSQYALPVSQSRRRMRHLIR